MSTHPQGPRAHSSYCGAAPKKTAGLLQSRAAGIVFFREAEAHSGGNLSLIHESCVNFFSEHFNYSRSCKDHLGPRVP